MRIPAALLIVGLLLFLAAGLLAPQGGGASWEDSGEQGHDRLAQHLSEENQVRVIDSSLALLPDEAGEGDVLFLFPTHRPASTKEISQVEQFVQQGGLLVIAADGSNAAPWAKTFGVNFKGIPVMLPPDQEAECVPTEIPWTGTKHGVCLPGPTAFPDLDELSDGSVRFTHVAYSSIPVFLDLDGDGQLNLADQAAPAPMAAQWEHGNQGGRVVAIADGDVWRNYIVQAEGGNLEFARALADGGRSGTVYLDNSGSQSTLQQRTQNTWYRFASASDIREQLVLSSFFAASVVGAVFAPRVQQLRPHAPPLASEDPDVRERGLAALAQRINPTVPQAGNRGQNGRSLRRSPGPKTR